MRKNERIILKRLILNQVFFLSKRPKHLIEKCHNYLEEILFTLTTMTGLSCFCEFMFYLSMIVSSKILFILTYLLNLRKRVALRKVII